MPQGFVYIMGSNTGTLYIGVTSRLAERVMQHKRGAGSNFTALYGCHRLLYYETFVDIRAAIQREKSLKGITRAKKLALIEMMNREYRDLAATWGAIPIGPQQSITQVEEWLQQNPSMDPQCQPDYPGESRKPLRQGKPRRDPSLRSG